MSVGYDKSTVLETVRGGVELYRKSLHFKYFSILVEGEGGHKISRLKVKTFLIP